MYLNTKKNCAENINSVLFFLIQKIMQFLQNNKFILFGVLLMLSSCSFRQVTDIDNIKEDMNPDTVMLVIDEISLDEQLVDSNANLIAYFKDYCNEKGAEVQPHWPEEEQIAKVWNAIEKLQNYIKGESQVYPRVEVQSVLNAMFLEQAYLESHSGYEYALNNPGRTFLLHFLEKAVKYCPRIEYLTEIHDKKGEVGIMNYRDWSESLPLYSFIVYKNKNGGFDIRNLGKLSKVMVTDIKELLDKEGNRCYLLQNYNNRFAIYRYKEGKMKRTYCSWE